MASEEVLQAAYEDARDAQAKKPTKEGHEKQQKAADRLAEARTKRKAEEAADPDHPREFGTTSVGVDS